MRKKINSTLMDKAFYKILITQRLSNKEKWFTNRNLLTILLEQLAFNIKKTVMESLIALDPIMLLLLDFKEHSSSWEPCKTLTKV